MFELSADESSVIIGTCNGDLSGWDVGTGSPLWRRTANDNKLRTVSGVSIGQDGKTFVAWERPGRAYVFSATTGLVIADLIATLGVSSIEDVVLSPKANKGLLLTGDKRLVAFGLAPRLMVVASRTGVPWSYSADGKYILCTGYNSIGEQFVRAISDREPSFSHEVGGFVRVHWVRPLPDGSFLITGTRKEHPNTDERSTAGFHYRPSDGDFRELWRLTMPKSASTEKMDFSEESMLGVLTEYNLKTRVMDLRTHTVVFEVDNSSNLPPARPAYLDLLDSEGIVLCSALGGVAMGFVGIVLLLYRRTARMGRSPKN